MTEYQRRSVHKVLSLLVHRMGISLVEACRDLEAAYVLAQRADLANEVQRVRAALLGDDDNAKLEVA